MSAVADDDDEVLTEEYDPDLDDENIISDEEIKAAKAKKLGRMIEFGFYEYEVVHRSSAVGKNFISTTWLRKPDGSVRAGYA